MQVAVAVPDIGDCPFAEWVVKVMRWPDTV
jgi:hypothetical protein